MNFINKIKALIRTDKKVEYIQITKLHVNNNSNKWNKLAIDLANENTKPPSQRHNIATRRLRSLDKKLSLNKSMSINDWNILALSRLKD